MNTTSLFCVNDMTWELPRIGSMRTPVRFIADDSVIESLAADNVLQQFVNIAHLPGIVECVHALPNARRGYGFPIGTVVATDPDNDGVVSPVGVGYDINCGLRLLTTNVSYASRQKQLREIAAGLNRDIPCEPENQGAIEKPVLRDMKRVLEIGARWAIENDFGVGSDLNAVEENGCMTGADAALVSDRARSWGQSHFGTIGSGNHFVELGFVSHIFDNAAAQALGLFVDNLTIMFHSGSRGLGYRVCDEFIHRMARSTAKQDLDLPDSRLCCAPVHSQEGREYLAAMAAAANFAWANRQVLTALARKSLQRTIRISEQELGARVLHDAAHNIARFEVHNVQGIRRRLCVHRKGAAAVHRKNGHTVFASSHEKPLQPLLLIGGAKEDSYVYVAENESEGVAFGSCCPVAASISRCKKADDKVTMHSLAPIIEKAGLGHRVARISPLASVKS